MPWNKNSELSLPADDATIWRYMDLSKFLSLLEQKALYFALCAELEDKWEARVHRADFHAMVKNYGPEVATELRHLFKQINSAMAVNCWYCGDEESVAMWTLYTQTQYGIAIRSNIGRLKRAFESTPLIVQIGMVQYRNLEDSTCVPLDTRSASIQMLLLQKRLCYQHERELRAYLIPPTSGASKATGPSHDPLPLKYGLLVPVDLAELIESVRLGPRFPKWATALIDSAFKRADISPAISESAAFAPPPEGS